MKVKIYKGKAKGTVFAPPSKSMAHRLLICAGLSKGKSVIKGISKSEDVLATIDCLKALGAECSISGDIAEINGVDIKTASINGEFNCRESGSTMRFFIPLALLTGKNVVFNGSKKLLSRPMSVYQTLCQEQKMFFSQDESSIVVKGPLKAWNFRLAGNISSQFISGLLFALPLLNKDSTISIIPPIESRSYIDLSIDALRQFSVEVYWKDENTLFIKGNQEYKSIETSVEGDYSNAAFLSALNLVGGDVEVQGLNENSLQGDKVYKKYFESLSVGTPTLHISNCPDLGPILFSVAASNYGGIFTGTKRLRLKESDRVEAMAEELRKFSTAVKVHDDSLVIYPIDFKAPEEELYGHNDHRVVMSLAVLLTLTGGIIDGAEAIKKSYPDFFENLRSLGIKVEEYEA